MSIINPDSDIKGKERKSVLVLGIGNFFRGDDGIGLEVVCLLKSRIKKPEVEVMTVSGEGTKLMEAWKGKDRVIMIDALSVPGKAVGEIYRFDIRKENIPSDFIRSSTHNFGIYEAIELSKALNQLPERLVLWGIAGVNYETGSEISNEVRSSIAKLVEKVLEEISQI